MRNRTSAAALFLTAALASPGFAQSTTTPFSFTPSAYTYTVVDTSKAFAPTTTSSSATTMGNPLTNRPINVTGALQQSYNPIQMSNMDPTRSLLPRQQTSMFQIPNVFSRITSVNLVPSFFRTRTTTTRFPTGGPQRQ